MPAAKKQKDNVVNMNEPKVRKPREPRESKPAATPESRELQLVNLAVDLAEKQLRDGTASAAVQVHYLKIGSTREVIEREILEKQAALIEAKSSSIGQAKETKTIAEEAFQALKTYNSSS